MKDKKRKERKINKIEVFMLGFLNLLKVNRIYTVDIHVAME